MPTNSRNLHFHDLPLAVIEYIKKNIKHFNESDQKIYLDYFASSGLMPLKDWAKKISSLYYTFNKQEVDELFFPLLFGESE